jgi:hypothetical protein
MHVDPKLYIKCLPQTLLEWFLNDNFLVICSILKFYIIEIGFQ